MILRRLLSTIFHRLCLHQQCECDCGGRWSRADPVNPIHPDGPPLWFDHTCYTCGHLLKSVSSGGLERAAWRSVERGESTSDQALDVIAALLPPRVLRDTYDDPSPPDPSLTIEDRP